MDQSLIPTCHPGTGMPCWLRYCDEPLPSGDITTTEKTLSDSTSWRAASWSRVRSPPSSRTTSWILRAPSSPVLFALSIRARRPSSVDANDCACSPLFGRIAPTLIVVSVIPGSLTHGFGAAIFCATVVLAPDAGAAVVPLPDPPLSLLHAARTRTAATANDVPHRCHRNFMRSPPGSVSVTIMQHA